eukprot:JP446894.1.p1 GENE.JP446894.1~~JP446894.1.p1  ORF type:complete len:160 (-),score=68.68 JP446894.1:297-776(-)
MSFLRPFSRTFLRAAEEASSATSGGKKRLSLNFYTPNSTPAQKEVDMVIVPGAAGSFGVLVGHVPVVSQLKPGVVEIHDGGKVEQFFVSSGFAFVSTTAADICAVEAAPVSDLDSDTIKENISTFTKTVADAQNDMDKATAQVGLDVNQAMLQAITGAK